MEKESYYFSHDSNARNDVKIIKLRRQLGLEGYGLYWCLIEMLRETPEYKLHIDTIDDIAFSLNISKEKVDTVIKCYDLFTVDEDRFFSERLIRSMEKYNTTKKRLSDAGKNGASKKHNKQINNGKIEVVL
jgi:hypothetical protein